jgi:acyl carrier protein
VSLTKEILLDYFRDQLNVDTSQIQDDTPLFSSGMVDSFAIVELIMHLGQYTGTPLGPEDIDLENLDTINRIMAYVAAKAAE